ncbi:PilX N-terminal domain-containing pilus assembly protein [Vreelandella sp. EE22]
MSRRVKMPCTLMTRCSDPCFHGRPRQQGAALVVVMVVLASALMLGIVGVQSALVDQRLAANYHAALKAQMRAESAAAHALRVFDTLDWKDAPTLEANRQLHWFGAAGQSGAVHHCPQRSCLYLPVIRQEEPWVMALGVVYTKGDQDALLAAHSEPVFVRVQAGQGGESQHGATILWD